MRPETSAMSSKIVGLGQIGIWARTVTETSEWKREARGWLSFPMKVYSLPRSKAWHSREGRNMVFFLQGTVTPPCQEHRTNQGSDDKMGNSICFGWRVKGRPDTWRESKLTLEECLLFSFNPLSLMLKLMFNHRGGSQRILKMSCFYDEAFPQLWSQHFCIFPVAIHSSVQNNHDSTAQRKDNTQERICFSFHIYVKGRCGTRAF